MIQAIQKKLNNRKGFTLIELIVVIVILGILAAILVPTFGGYATRARDSADEAIIANIKTAMAVALAEGEIAVGDKLVITNGSLTAVAATGTTQDAIDAVNVTMPEIKVGKVLQGTKSVTIEIATITTADGKVINTVKVS